VPENWLDDDQQAGGDGGVPAASESQAAGSKNPIGPVKGYPETGKGAWRAANDDTIVSAVEKFNSQHQYLPGDMGYMTPELMKSWMMRESGGSPEAFKTDPFQVNNHGDWVDEKGKFAGLTKGQEMTPETSAEAALKWMHYKGRIDEKTRGLTPYQGHYEGLRRYNAAPAAPGIPRGADYANALRRMSWAFTSYGMTTCQPISVWSKIFPSFGSARPAMVTPAHCYPVWRMK